MIQRMSQIGRKGGVLSFILFTPKWSHIKDPEKIEKQSNNSNNTSSALASITSINAQLFNNNCSKVLPEASLLSLVYNTQDELSDLESVVDSKAESRNEFDEETNLFSEVFATEADQTQSQ